MSLVDANHAIEAFLDAIGAAQAMADRGNVGVEFEYLLRHAKELLDLVDEEASKVDTMGNRDLMVSAAMLHEKLERLGDHLRGGTAY